jgi:membrane protease YdiL (CAAX protease family)
MIVTTAPATDADVLVTLVFAAVCLAVGLTIAWGLGVFRAESVAGPVRIGGDRPIAGLMIVTALAATVWIMSQVAYATSRAAEFRSQNTTRPFDESVLSAADYAFLSTVPFVIGWLILVVGDAMLPGQRIISRLGYGISNLVVGVGKGIVAMTVTLPLIWSGSMLLELLYRACGFKHPSEHELLGAMKGASQGVQMLLVVGACVAAPVFEEFLFRGHLQTVLVRLFTPRPMPRIVAPLAMATAAPTADALPMPPVQPLPVLDCGQVEPSPGFRWLAIGITSFIFAIVHPIWMAPLIFVLAVCLGYAYERTGNLWTSITMHAIFNISSTVIFLKFM